MCSGKHTIAQASRDVEAFLLQDKEAAENEDLAMKNESVRAAADVRR